MEATRMQKLFFGIGWAGLFFIIVGLIIANFLKTFDLTSSLFVGIGALFSISAIIVNKKRMISFLLQRGTKKGLTNIVWLIIISVVLVILYVVNLYYTPGRVDLTENSRYTLSDRTEEVLDNLDEEINVLVFQTETRLPASQVGAKLSDLLDEYEYHSRNVNIIYIDPEKNPDLLKEYGIPVNGGAGSMIIEKTAESIYEKMQSNFGIEKSSVDDEDTKVTDEPKPDDTSIGKNKRVLVTYGELAKWNYVTKTVPLNRGRILEAFYGEEKLTNAISSVSSKNQPALYFLTGHGELSIDDESADGMGLLKNDLYAANFDVKTIDLSVSSTIPNECSVLVVAGPKQPIPKEQLDEIDRYLKHGGRAIIMADPPINGIDSNISEVTKIWSIDMNDDIVLSKIVKQHRLSLREVLQKESVVAQTPVKFTPHPQLVPQDLRNKSDFFYGVRTLERKNIAGKGFKLDSFILINKQQKGNTSQAIWSERNLKDLNIVLDVTPKTFDLLGDTYYGNDQSNLPSFDGVNDKDMVGVIGFHLTYPLDPDETAKKKADKRFEFVKPEDRITNETRLIVIGDSDWISNRKAFLANKTPNPLYRQAYINSYIHTSKVLFMKSLEWLANREDNIKVPPKEEITRNMFMTSVEGLTVLFFTVLLMPLMAGFFGFLMYNKRTVDLGAETQVKGTHSPINKWIGSLGISFFILFFIAYQFKIVKLDGQMGNMFDIGLALVSGMFIITMLIDLIEYFYIEAKEKFIITKKLGPLFILLLVPIILGLLMETGALDKISIISDNLQGFIGVFLVLAILLLVSELVINNGKKMDAIRMLSALGMLLFAGLIIYFVLFFIDLLGFQVNDEWIFQPAIHIVLIQVFGFLLGIHLYNINRFKDVQRSRTILSEVPSIFTLMITMVVFVALYLIAVNYPDDLSADWGETEGMKLSEQSQRVIDKIDSEVRIKIFETEENLKNWDMYNLQVGEKLVKLLKNYDRASDKLKVEFIDYRTHQNLLQYYVRRFSMPVGRESLSLVIEKVNPDGSPTGNKEDVRIVRQRDLIFKPLEVLERTRAEFIAEAKITGKITSLFTKSRVIGYLEGHGERGLEDINKDGMSRIGDALKMDNYELVSINTKVENAIPVGVELIMVNGPTAPLFPHEISLIENYLKRGGDILAFIDPKTDLNQTNFDELLEKWGLDIDDNGMVYEELSQNVAFGKTYQRRGVEHIVNYIEHPVTEPLIQDRSPVFFSLTRAIDKVQNPPEGAKYETLLTTSDKALIGMPTEEGVVIKRKDAPFNVGMYVEIPVDKNVEKKISDKTSIMVYGDSDFLQNQRIMFMPNSKDLVLNSVNYITGETSRIAIRPRIAKIREMVINVEEGVMILLFYSIFIPAIIAFAGILYNVRRKRIR